MEPLSALKNRKKSTVLQLTRSSKIFKTIIQAIQDKKGTNIISSADYVNDRLGNWFYMKEDSSIGSGGYKGFELVSHPISFSSWSDMKAFNNTLDYLREHQEARAWDASNCGLHIHVH